MSLYDKIIAVYNKLRGRIDGHFPVQTADIADGAVVNAKLGNEAVSGSKIRDKSITRGKIADSAVDSTPTAESNNLVTSGGVKSALDGMRDKLDLAVYDFLPETWEVSNTLYSGGTYSWDAASNQWLGANGTRSIRAKVGAVNTYQFVIDPGASGETTVCEWEGTAKQDVPFKYRGESYVVTVEGRGNAGLKPTGDTLAKKSEVDTFIPLLLAQFYPDGSVKSAVEFTAGIKYDAPDTTNRTITVKPFCNTGDSENDNSGLGGRVVIPPFVDAQGNPYITDDGTRFKVVGLSGRKDLPDSNNILTAIIAPNTVTTIEDRAFYDCTTLTTASLPAATAIGDSAFYNCISLSSVSLPAATTIQKDAFPACISLSSISLPAATIIEEGAFGICEALTSIFLPSATTIGDYAFESCTALTAVNFGDTPRLSVPTLGEEEPFRLVPTTCKIIVPDAQYDAWTAASGWSDLVTAGYKFLKHSEWEYARKYEVDKKANDTDVVHKSGDETMGGMLTLPKLNVGASNTVSGSGGATAQGVGNISSSYAAHSEGVSTKSTGQGSHAEGAGTFAQNNAEHAQGRYNSTHKQDGNFGSPGNTLSSIGFGTSDDARKNAVETMQDGKTFIYGLGGYDGTNPTGDGVKDIAAAVNGKASKADATLTERWTPTFSLTAAQKEAFSLTPGASDNDYALTVGKNEGGTWTLYVGSYNAASLMTDANGNLVLSGGDARLGLQVGDLVATPSGYRLGPDEKTNPNLDKPIASIADATLNERGFSAWVWEGTPPTYEGKEVVLRLEDYPFGPDDNGKCWVAFTVDGEQCGPNGDSAARDDDNTKTTVTVYVGGGSGYHTATRTALPGYQLGSQTDKPLASETEAEALRTAVASKQSALSAQQLANIAAVPNKANDADVVHKSGDTMTGPLTVKFSSTTGSNNIAIASEDNQMLAGFSFANNGDILIRARTSISIPPRFTPTILPCTIGGTLALTAGTGYEGNLAALDEQGNPTDSQIPKASVVTIPTYNGQNRGYVTSEGGGDLSSWLSTNGATESTMAHGPWTMPRSGIIYMQLQQMSNTDTSVRIGVNGKPVKIENGSVVVDYDYQVVECRVAAKSDVVYPLFLNAGDKLYMRVYNTALSKISLSAIFYP